MKTRLGWVLCLLALAFFATTAVAQEPEAPTAPETPEEAPEAGEMEEAEEGVEEEATEAEEGEIEEAESLEEGIEAVAEEEPEPVPPSLWKVSLDLGAYTTGGNTRTRGLTFFGDATRDTEDDIFQIKLSDLYGEDRGKRTINEHILSFQYAVKQLPTYYFAFLSFEHDQFEGIDLRTIFSPGVGHVVIDEEKRKLRGEAGPSVQHEYRRKPQRADFEDEDDPARKYDEAIAAWEKEESVWTAQLRITGHAEQAVFDNARIIEDVEWYPGYRSEQYYVYRLTSITTFEQPLSETWAFKLMFIYKYNSDVGRDINRHDWKLVLTLGVKL